MLYEVITAPNDFLVNGDPAEIANWKEFRGQVDNIFAQILEERNPAEIQKFLQELRNNFV